MFVSVNVLSLGLIFKCFCVFTDPKVTAEDWYPSYSNWENNSDWSIPPAALHCLYMKSQTNMGKSTLENVNI